MVALSWSSVRIRTDRIPGPGPSIARLAKPFCSEAKGRIAIPHNCFPIGTSHPYPVRVRIARLTEVQQR